MKKEFQREYIAKGVDMRKKWGEEKEKEIKE